ncbi:transposase [Streptomyces phyllanthi]|uniref:Transposase n=1 Tax=Streptomyces phyllanthi TaxID=1803180 RepID=A0A5N8W393_9ACTN|nr:transposase [Streptomyces phyllanthi]MPY41963.1 transposase [Streptomyces phyllanthi]
MGLDLLASSRANFANGRQIYAARQAKELLRDLLHLAVNLTPDRSTVSAARHRFLAHVADHAHLPELVTLAETVEQWWDGIETYLTTGITNATSEGNNRLIKLEARNAFGLRNRENQRLRSRCATTRRSRREAYILRPVFIGWLLRRLPWRRAEGCGVARAAR